MAYVVDPSVALAWLLPDETNARADAVRVAVENGADAWIPAHWWLEIGNGLLMAERRGRITANLVAQALSLVNALPFEEDEETAGTDSRADFYAGSQIRPDDLRCRLFGTGATTRSHAGHL